MQLPHQSPAFDSLALAVAGACAVASAAVATALVVMVLIMGQGGCSFGLPVFAAAEAVVVSPHRHCRAEQDYAHAVGWSKAGNAG